MYEDDATGEDFTRVVRAAFARSGFAAPNLGEARVLLLESAVWARHVMAAEHLLDATEHCRAARFRFDHDRMAYVLAHALWRIALGVCLELDAVDVPLVRTPSGQPQLPGTGLATSLSHSGSWVAITVCVATTVGIDIERSPSRITLDDLLATICTPTEAEDMRRLSADMREQALLALWTRKEALLKAFGVGLSAAPATLSAATAGLVVPPAAAADLPPCRVRDLDLPVGLVGALAAPAVVELCRLHLPD